MEQITLDIVDDPANVRVFKGPGHFAATRAEAAIRKLESVFPQLRFEVGANRDLTSLKATALVHTPIRSEEFMDALTEALVLTGTRMAPLRESAVDCHRRQLMG
jgi:hypothetical protein